MRLNNLSPLQYYNKNLKYSTSKIIFFSTLNSLLIKLPLANYFLIRVNMKLVLLILKSPFTRKTYVNDASGQLFIDWINNCQTLVSNQIMMTRFINSHGVGTVSEINYSINKKPTVQIWILF